MMLIRTFTAWPGFLLAVQRRKDVLVDERHDISPEIASPLPQYLLIMFLIFIQSYSYTA